MNKSYKRFRNFILRYGYLIISLSTISFGISIALFSPQVPFGGELYNYNETAARFYGIIIAQWGMVTLFFDMIPTLKDKKQVILRSLPMVFHFISNALRLIANRDIQSVLFVSLSVFFVTLILLLRFENELGG